MIMNFVYIMVGISFNAFDHGQDHGLCVHDRKFALSMYLIMDTIMDFVSIMASIFTNTFDHRHDHGLCVHHGKYIYHMNTIMDF